MFWNWIFNLVYKFYSFFKSFKTKYLLKSILFVKTFIDDCIPILKYLILLFLSLAEPIFYISITILLVYDDITPSLPFPEILEPKVAYTMGKFSHSDALTMKRYTKQLAEKLYDSNEIKTLISNHNPQYYTFKSKEAQNLIPHPGIEFPNYLKYTSIQNPKLGLYATSNVSKLELFDAHKQKTLHIWPSVYLADYESVKKPSYSAYLNLDNSNFYEWIDKRKIKGKQAGTLLVDPSNFIVTPVNTNAVFTSFEFLNYLSKGMDSTNQFWWYGNLQDEVVEALHIFKNIQLTTPCPDIFNNPPSYITQEDLYKEQIRSMDQALLHLQKK